ncbi:hypothetical protein H0H92_000561 [Tricholoma furcatifolium]|nr:hypothetical protein H0H92_000561 [Tricholoma furcatifolium]
MPLARSSTQRSHSRSPIPPTSTTRPFLPPSHYAAAAGVPYVDKDDVKDQFARAYMPAYPYDAEPGSNSPFHLNINPSVDKKPVLPPMPNQRNRRESLLNDLPQLEANLLPSLRDTIDRMTKSPAQPEPSNTTRLNIPRPSVTSRSSRSLSPSYTSREQPLKYCTPEPCSRVCDSPIEVLVSRTNMPIKLPPKSALRTSALKPHSKFPEDSPPVSVLNAPKKARRGTTPSPNPDGGLPRRSTLSHGSKATIPALRLRSGTDPGRSPNISVIEQPSTSKNVDSQGTPRLLPSNLPRPQPRRAAAGTYWSTDDSDDSRVEQRGRERRPAVPYASSHLGSKSEDARGKAARATSKTRSGSHSGKGGVGLGLNIDAGRAKSTDSSRQGSTLSHTDISRPAHRTTGDRTPEPSQTPTFDTPSNYVERRKALLHIVSHLDLDNNAPEEAESDYNGEDGVAVSGSQDLAEEIRSHLQEQEFERGRSPEQAHRKIDLYSRKEYSMSANHTPTPTFLLPDPDNRYSSTCTPQNKHYPAPPSAPKPKQTQPQQTNSNLRSPIVPGFNAAATVPNATHRHSVHRRASGPIAPHTSNNDNNSGDRQTSSARKNHDPGVLQAPRGSTQQRYESNPSSATDLRPRVASAAGREDATYSYGSPPEDPVGTLYSREDNHHPPSHADSDLSSVGSMYWGDNSDSELSPAAEKLFRKLGQGKGDKQGLQANSEKTIRTNILPPSRSSSPSAPVQIEDNPSYEPDRRPRSRSSWLATPPAAPIEPSADYTITDTETRRQDLITEIYDIEEAFVKRLQNFVQLFILPLRVQDTKEWIAGVPTEVAHLFDWLEDIVVLHTQLFASLGSTRDAQYPHVAHIADSIRAYVPRLEVYQPYLVNLEDVIGLVEQLIQDEQSDFGEFVRLQETASECEGWNFQTFLIEPVNLLARFPNLFSKLLDLTPKGHRDYLPTYALVRSTEMFIRVMTEVKLREDEYDLIQQFAARIQGLTPSDQLSSRERRLLHHGILELVDVEANDLPVSSGTSKLFRYFPPDANFATNRARQVLTTTHEEKGTLCGRSGSSSSLSTGVSIDTLQTSSSAASSTFFSSFKLTVPLGRFKPTTIKRLPSPTPAPRGSNSTNLPKHSAPSHGTPVQVFVFSDLLLLAALVSPSGTGHEWTLLNHIGTTRILDIHEHQHPPGHDMSDSTAITLEVLSVDTRKINHTPNRDLGGRSMFRLHLEVPPVQPDDAFSQGDSNRKWNSVLHRCQKFTMCSLSIPTRNHDPQLDAAFDKEQAVFSLLSSGLPLPKSPSAQIAGVRRGESTDDAMKEREERGWWSLRFQQVFRELQRQDLALAAALDA